MARGSGLSALFLGGLWVGVFLPYSWLAGYTWSIVLFGQGGDVVVFGRVVPYATRISILVGMG